MRSILHGIYHFLQLLYEGHSYRRHLPELRRRAQIREARELQVARSAIAGRGIDLSHAHIFGDSIFWPVFKDLSFQWAPSVMSKQPPGTSYLICGLDPPLISLEHVCADELPAFGDMQLVEQFSWAGRRYLVYERRE
jgi:hypothetical protein